VATPTNLSNIYTVGLNNVGSYQSSAMPFCSGGIDVNSYGAAGVKIEFPYVTSWIIITNDKVGSTGNPGDDPIYVGFSQAGVQGTNRIRVNNPSNNAVGWVRTNRWDLKITEIWLSGSSNAVSIVAGLTNIPVSRITAVSPSGSNWSGSVGVG